MGYAEAMLESSVEEVFNDRVRQLGGLSFKFVPAHKGNPDRIVLLNGEVLLVELKTLTGTVSPAQRLWHKRAAQLGVIVHVVKGSAEARAWNPYL